MEHNLQKQISNASLIRSMVPGAAINLVLIGLLLTANDYVKPEWGTYWMVRPLIIVPFGGAVGGAVFYFANHYRKMLGINKAVAMVGAFIIYMVGLWMSTILGLAGTLWN